MARYRRRKHFKFSLDSNRDGHMTAAVFIGACLAFAGIANDWNWLLYAGFVTVAWEWLATPDVDYANRRSFESLEWAIVCLLWLPYSSFVPHRSIYSHSLLIGLPLRMIYVGIPLCSLLIWMDVDVIILASTWWPSIVAGCIAADITHLLKDGYDPIEMLIGK